MNFVISDGGEYSIRREATIIPGNSNTLVAFTKRQQSTDQREALSMLLTEAELNSFIQWYLKVMYHKDLALPHTAEHAEYIAESDARRTQWQKQLHTAKEE